MTARRWTRAAGLGSAALLAGAFGFQYLGGLAPCSLCLTQRWPHAVAVIAAMAAMVLPFAVLRLIGLGAALTTAGVGAYHGLVERGILAGPDSCTANDISTLSVEDLMAQINAAPLIRCDEVAWSLMGLSMAEWNAVLSLGLAMLWLFALRQSLGSRLSDHSA